MGGGGGLEEKEQQADAASSRLVTSRCANKTQNHLSAMENSHPGSASGFATQGTDLTQQGESPRMAEIQLYGKLCSPGPGRGDTGLSAVCFHKTEQIVCHSSERRQGFSTLWPTGPIQLVSVFRNKPSLESCHAHLYTDVFDCFCTTMTKLSYFDRDHMAPKLEIFTIWPFTEKDLWPLLQKLSNISSRKFSSLQIRLLQLAFFLALSVVLCLICATFNSSCSRLYVRNKVILILLQALQASITAPTFNIPLCCDVSAPLPFRDCDHVSQLCSCFTR